jgi:hypothetical protein
MSTKSHCTPGYEAANAAKEPFGNKSIGYQAGIDIMAQNNFPVGYQCGYDPTSARTIGPPLSNDIDYQSHGFRTVGYGRTVPYELPRFPCGS